MIWQSCWTRSALEAGKRWSAGRSEKMAASLSGSIAAIVAGIQLAPEPLLQVPRRAEGPLQRDLLVEHHADQEGQRVVGHSWSACGCLRGGASRQEA